MPGQRSDWHAVEIPRRMRSLQRDHRGYPVPFIVLRDTNGKPHFSVNDHRRVNRCLKEKRCAICGNGLDKVFWFAGGPMSAFHPDGWYLDTPLHHDCMTYAMRVCPYLAAPNYSGRVDAGTLDPTALTPEMKIMFDYTVNPDRPQVFVAVGSGSMEKGRVLPGGAVYVRPVSPYSAVEFWQGGEKLSSDAGRDLMKGIVERVE